MLKKKNSAIALIPSIIMFVTTITALIYQGIKFYKSENYLLGNTSIILVILAFFVLNEGIEKIKTLRKKNTPRSGGGEKLEKHKGVFNENF